jgi:hypothetical protein
MKIGCFRPCCLLEQSQTFHAYSLHPPSAGTEGLPQPCYHMASSLHAGEDPADYGGRLVRGHAEKGRQRPVQFSKEMCRHKPSQPLALWGKFSLSHSYPRSGCDWARAVKPIVLRLDDWLCPCCSPNKYRNGCELRPRLGPRTVFPQRPIADIQAFLSLDTRMSVRRGLFSYNVYLARHSRRRFAASYHVVNVAWAQQLEKDFVEYWPVTRPFILAGSVVVSKGRDRLL